MKKILFTLLFLLPVLVGNAQTPQAIWTKGNTTLTFLVSADEYKPGDTYKDEVITAVWSGTSITQSSTTSHPAWNTTVMGSLTKVVFTKSFAQVKPTSTAQWFCECSNLQTIEGLQYLNTSNVTDMSEMFYGCSGLTSLDVSHFDTSKVRNMGDMFEGCSGLTSLDVSHFDTSKVTNMSSMFRKCSSLTSLDVSNFDTSKVTNMRGMFEGCSGLTSLDLSKFDTSNVRNMGDMFKGCSGLTSLDLSKFDTSNVTYMGGMFEGCTNLKMVNMAMCEISCQLSSMFKGCEKLETIYCNYKWIASYSYDMFSGCVNLVGGQGMTYSKDKTDATYANPGENGYFTTYITDADKSRAMAIWCGKSQTLYYLFSDKNYAPGDTYKGETVTTVLVRGAVTNRIDYDTNWIFNPKKVVFDSSFAMVKPTSTAYWFYDCSDLRTIEGIQFLDTSNVTDMSEMFYGCSSLTSIDLSHFNTSNVTNMEAMFYNCSSLTSLDLSKFDTSNVTDMYRMFYGCSSLTSLDLSKFDTSNVTYINGMFSRCSSLTSLDVSKFDTSNVTDMSEMFYGCSSLTSLDLSHFNTSNVMRIYQMFSGCSGLTSLDLSKFDTSNVTDMIGMFSGCTNLTTLNLANFSTESLPYMGSYLDYYGMFENCSSLKTIYCNSTWNTDKYSADMFHGCTSLVGGEGMTYDASKTDVSYANPGENGYFTKVPTGIEDIENDGENAVLQNGILYDMSGRPVGDVSSQRIEELHLQPGVYILNGKKIMVR